MTSIELHLPVARSSAWDGSATYADLAYDKFLRTYLRMSAILEGRAVPSATDPQKYIRLDMFSGLKYTGDLVRYVESFTKNASKFMAKHYPAKLADPEYTQVREKLLKEAWDMMVKLDELCGSTLLSLKNRYMAHIDIFSKLRKGKEKCDEMRKKLQAVAQSMRKSSIEAKKRKRDASA